MTSNIRWFCCSVVCCGVVSSVMGQPTNCENPYGSAPGYRVFGCRLLLNFDMLDAELEHSCSAGGGFAIWWHPEVPEVSYDCGVADVMCAEGTSYKSVPCNMDPSQCAWDGTGCAIVRWPSLSLPEIDASAYTLQSTCQDWIWPGGAAAAWAAATATYALPTATDVSVGVQQSPEGDASGGTNGGGQICPMRYQFVLVKFQSGSTVVTKTYVLVWSCNGDL